MPKQPEPDYVDFFALPLPEAVVESPSGNPLGPDGLVSECRRHPDGIHAGYCGTCQRIKKRAARKANGGTHG